MDKLKLTNKRIPAILLIVAGAASLILGVLGLTSGGRMDPQETRDGIVWIYAEATKEGKPIGGSGTGWAIGKPGEPVLYIVTNGHVINDAHTASADQNPSIKVYFSKAENDFSIAQVVFFSPFEKKDIAILKLPSATDKRIPLRIRESESVEIGENAFALGYPSLSSNNQQYVTYDRNDITLTSGVISKKLIPNHVDYEGFQVDAPFSPGNSGGPLVDKNGNVIGINTLRFRGEGQNTGSNIYVSITSQELIEILDSERIDYAMARNGFYWMQGWMPYAFLGLGLLAIAAGLYMIRSQTSQSTSVMTEVGQASRQVKSPGQGPEKKKPVLRGITGKFSGQSFELEKSKLVIGRDPASSNIVFEVSEPGISRRHCQLAYDPVKDNFLITDLGSTHGTYLGNGKKLSANVPEVLSAGDTFYLNNTSNRFLVTKE